MTHIKARFFIVFAVLSSLGVAPVNSARAQWVQTYGPYGGAVLCFATNGSNLFAGTSSGGVILSTNNGTSWTAVNTGLTSPDVFALAVKVSTDGHGTNLFAGTWGGGVFLSTNDGTSWTAVNTGLADANGYAIVYALAVKVSTDGHGTNLFAGTEGGGVFLSTNDGTSWTAVNAGLTHVTGVGGFAVSGTNLFAATYRGGVFLSTNNGASWTAIDTGLPSTNNVTNVLAFAVSGTNLFAGIDFGGGIFLSTNDGTSWTAAGLTSSGVSALAVSGTNLLAGTNEGGVWRRPLAEMISQSAVQEKPRSTQALRIYPNPVSQSTTISFTPEASGYAEISIVNLLGVEVARLFAGELGAGEHTFTWDASAGATGGSAAADATGVYECLVRMNGRVDVLPVLLVR